MPQITWEAPSGPAPSLTSTTVQNDAIVKPRIEFTEFTGSFQGLREKCLNNDDNKVHYTHHYWRKKDRKYIAVVVCERRG